MNVVAPCLVSALNAGIELWMAGVSAASQSPSGRKRGEAMPAPLSAVMSGDASTLWIMIGQRVAEIPSNGRIPRNRKHHLKATHSSRCAAIGSLLSSVQQLHHAAFHMVWRCGWDANSVVRRPLSVRIHEAGGGGREVRAPNEPPAHLWQRGLQGSERGLLLYPRKRRPWRNPCACPPPRLHSCCTAAWTTRKH